MLCAAEENEGSSEYGLLRELKTWKTSPCRSCLEHHRRRELRGGEASVHTGDGSTSKNHGVLSVCTPTDGCREAVRAVVAYCLLANDADQARLDEEKICVGNGPRVESGPSHNQVGQVLADSDGRVDSRPELIKQALEGLQMKTTAKTEEQTELSALSIERVKVKLQEMLQVCMNERLAVT